MTKNFFIPDESKMLALGGILAKVMTAGVVIFLQGQLGAGKTTLVRGFLRGLGYTGHVKSPTYTLVEPYEFSALMVYHFDLYRLKDPGELEYMGLQDYFTAHAICLIEWPEQGQGRLPAADLVVDLAPYETGRTVKIQALTLCGQPILEKLS